MKTQNYIAMHLEPIDKMTLFGEFFGLGSLHSLFECSGCSPTVSFAVLFVVLLQTFNRSDCQTDGAYDYSSASQS